MTRSALLGVVAGAALVVVLFATNDVGAIAAVVAGAGIGLLAPVALHLPQTFFSALAWRSLIAVERPPGLGRLFLLRWVREAVNALLPVAQVGGDLARVRLLAKTGVPLAPAAASGAVDLALEMATQIVFSLCGLALLLTVPASAPARGAILTVMAAASLVAVSFLASQRFGLFKLVEPWLQKLAAGGRPLGELAGLNGAVVDLYRSPRRYLPASFNHLVSWGLGAVETWAALQVLGLNGGWKAAVAVESLGQAVRGLGFLIPGALGVQEGGYILICGLFGLSASDALALSVVRRIRELALGLPGLWLWRRLEAERPIAASATPQWEATRPR